MIDFTETLPTPQSDLRTKQYFLIFSIMVAGKNAKATSRKTWDLLQWSWGQTPFEYLESLIKKGKLESRLREIKTGMYDKLLKAIPQATKLHVETCSTEDLENIHGVGPKTSRFFLMHTRKGFQGAVLDTHILKWLKERIGWYLPIPKSTPTGKKYLELEKHCVRLMGKNFPELTLAQADFEIWKQYAQL